MWYHTGIKRSIPVMPATPHLPAGVRYLVGVDGGGTGTRARVLQVASTVGAPALLLGQGEAGPSALGQGLEQAWRHVQLAIARAFDVAGVPEPAPSELALGLGLAGAHAPSRREAFIAGAPTFGLLRVDTDGGAALRGAHAGAPGAVVASGTGSVGEALRRDGRRLTVGGWGFGIGDEGSGGWLGLEAMRLAHRAIDGRASAGALARAVWSATAGERNALVDWCARAGQNGYARLAPLVFEHAEADVCARRLLEQAAVELEALAHALDPAADLPVVLTGSIAQRLEPWLSPALRRRCVAPQGDPIDGALRLLCGNALPPA